MQVDVSLLLEMLPEEPLAETTCVVIDVLRASTTILSALECNIPRLVPTATIEEAWEVSERLRGRCYLGGERNRVKPEGFHFGNSPLEYRGIAGQLPVVYTTTNGTRALRRAASAHQVLVGSLRNAAAVAEVLCQEAESVRLICSGTKGRIAAEDVFCAGAILQEMQSRAAIRMTDAARIALSSYIQVSGRLYAAMLETSSGQALSRLGFLQDVAFASELNVSSLIPEYAEGSITANRR